MEGTGAELKTADEGYQLAQSEVDRLEGERRATQRELDKAFFLDFGKKGELGDKLKEIKKDAKMMDKTIGVGEKAVAAASKSVEDAAERVEKANAQAEKIVSDARAEAARVEAAASKKANGVRKQAERNAR